MECTYNALIGTDGIWPNGEPLLGISRSRRPSWYRDHGKGHRERLPNGSGGYNTGWDDATCRLLTAWPATAFGLTKAPFRTALASVQFSSALEHLHQISTEIVFPPLCNCYHVITFFFIEIADTFAQGVHFNTFGGNPLASSIGSSVIDVRIFYSS